MKLRDILTASMSALTVASAMAWGQKGHDTTACIAENHLTQATQDSIAALLDGKSMVYWANWLDNASHTPEYAYSKTWHYKNIDAGQDFDKAPVNKEGDIVTALDQQIATLRNPKASKEEKALALKMTIHFLGDIHQPMHMGRATDRGGNRVTVKNFNRDSNLHSSWDSFIVENGHKWSYTEWQRQIDCATPAETVEILSIKEPRDWARQTYEIATRIYDATPEGTKLSYDYVAEWTPVVEQQFLRGGLRLADLLNSIFDSSYTTPAKK